MTAVQVREPARVCTCGNPNHTQSCPAWHRPGCPICAGTYRKDKR